MSRNGFLEETYHTWSFVPFRDREGTVIGYEVSSNTLLPLTFPTDALARPSEHLLRNHGESRRRASTRDYAGSRADDSIGTHERRYVGDR